MVQGCQNHWKTIDDNGALEKNITIPSLKKMTIVEVYTKYTKQNTKDVKQSTNFAKQNTKYAKHSWNIKMWICIPK